MAEQRYTYKIYAPFAIPGGFCDGYRAREFEKDDINYAVLQPNPPYEDDSMLVRWNGNEWITNFAMIIRGGTYPTGYTIKNTTEIGERAALVLLGYFGLETEAEKFTPEEVSRMSPDDLEKLARELHKKVLPTQNS